ncbi:MAG: ABC transporter ATP-binding protein [Deltaproteobacteria bacterium]|nr:ABC transporter ATP-binding protein [Deltaproteobacteria bacterium]
MEFIPWLMAAISIQEVVKSYQRVQALQGISLEIREGEFFGLLGPNGAGKTTLIKSIVGLARPSAGAIQVFGKNVQREPIATKALIGLSPQEPNIDRYFSIRRTLEFQGGYYGLSRVARRQRASELMGQFHLTEKADEEYWKLSGGTQKRVLIARSLMSSPKILILDEPTAGVDVEQRHELWAYLQGLNKDGTTIILTTHYIDEAETLCERVGIIDSGRLIELGTPRELITKHCERYFRVQGEKKDKLNGFGVDDIEVNRGSLEQVFLKLAGKSIYTDESVTTP